MTRNLPDTATTRACERVTVLAARDAVQAAV